MKIIRIKNIYKVLLLATVLQAASCSSFLEEQDPSNLTPQSYYTLPQHAEAAIASVYAETRFIGNGAGIFSNNWQLLDAPTGIQSTETAQNSDLNNLYALIYDGQNLHVRQVWTGLYRVVAQANMVLDKVPGIKMDEAQQKKILGEASFLRAWAYFYLVRLWGDVPLILKPVNSPEDPDFAPARAPQETVYQQIVADLTTAEAAGLPWMDASGRVSLAAVKSELAKVHLTMAGFPLNKGAASYQLAAAKAKEVIDFANSNPGVIGLFPNYSALRSSANDNKLENIFQVQYNYTAANSGNPLQSQYLPLHKPVSAIDGIGTSIPTQEFINSYEPGDLRAKYGEGYYFLEYYQNGSSPTLYNPGNPHVFKYFDPIANGTLGVPGTKNSDLNIPQIRYAEVLLIYAEAQNEVSGPNADAYNALKLIRDRAQLVTPDLGTYNQSTFREAVWRERWHELAYEGLTWFDMIRLQKVYNESTNGFDNFVGHVNKNSGQALTERQLLFPIPTPEMQNNPNLTPQNPGYPN